MWILQSPEGTFRLTSGAIKTVGRATQADFILDVALVSRLHCRLTAGEDNLEVVDLESTNGTYVNDRRLDTARIGSRPKDGGDIVTSRPVTEIVGEALALEIRKNGHAVVFDLNLMSHLARQEIYFDRQFGLDETLVGIERVTKEDVQRVAADLFRNGSLAATVLGNVNGLQIPSERLDLD